MSMALTGSQTVGPFFSIGLEHLHGDFVPASAAANPSSPEGSFLIEGTLLDGEGIPVPDAFLEIWQADAAGSYTSCDVSDTANVRGAQCPGFARVVVNAEGRFHFTTFKPGPVPYSAGRDQAPHLLILLFMRGLLRNLVTRMYFPDGAALDADPILQLVPEPRRDTLIARAAGPGCLHWDIVLRGSPNRPAETVFFAW